MRSPRRPFAPRFLAGCALASCALTAAGNAHAGNTLTIVSAQLDPPTVINLGVQVLISDDDNDNATITVRYRRMGDSVFHDGLPLHRAHGAPGWTLTPQFAGTIFDLAPGTAYEIELTATDPDGPVTNATMTLTGSTRPVPSDPASPRAVSVSDANSLRAALSAAQPGDVITLADGMYSGEFSINTSGTASNPIVIRGTSTNGTVIDGGDAGGNIIEVYGSYVHIERLTLQHDGRALRFQTAPCTGNVVRRVHIRDVVLGIGGRPGQDNAYFCDNTLEGRLSWPSVYADDGGAHANDDGINVMGNGNVVCHNTIVGFGDAMKTEFPRARAVDFYGNDVLSSYDNGVELDESEGNTRAFRNRFMNTYATLSFQPIYGGPAYAIRNVVVNVTNEQMKLHANGSMEPSGVIAYHNTFVSAAHAINLEAGVAVHDYDLENNLFVTVPSPVNGRTVNWDAPLDPSLATVDYDGYYPDAQFVFGYGTGALRYNTFAEMVAGGTFETHSTLLTGSIFASGLAAPSDYHTLIAPADVSLAPGSNAIDRGRVLANVDDGFLGAAPDLGAIESGCAPPIYGVRPDGVDESNEPTGCPGGTTGGDAGTGGNDAGTTGNDAGTSGNDAGGTRDSGGMSADGGGTRDASNVADGASNADGGTTGTHTGGCGCRATTDAGNSRGAWLAFAAVAMAVARRRRRAAR